MWFFWVELACSEDVRYKVLGVGYNSSTSYSAVNIYNGFILLVVLNYKGVLIERLSKQNEYE